MIWIPGINPVMMPNPHPKRVNKITATNKTPGDMHEDRVAIFLILCFNIIMFDNNDMTLSQQHIMEKYFFDAHDFFNEVYPR